MADTFSPKQIKQIRQVLEDVIDYKFEQKFTEKLGENFKERIDRIENNTDRACKIAKDTQEELAILGAKVDRHDKEIRQLQSFTGFATT